MKAKVFAGGSAPEFETAERCHIQELSNSADDEHVSIARARVEPGVTTILHRVHGIEERYLILEGTGRVEIGGSELVADVAPGDVVWIPAGVTQRIANTGSSDLVFLCICTPRFEARFYEPLESLGASSEEEARVVQLLVRDLTNTVGTGHRALVEESAAHLRLYVEAERYEDAIVQYVQQAVHDNQIDSSWPRCPEHSHHPLWYHQEWWTCEQSRKRVARLGELPSTRK